MKAFTNGLAAALCCVAATAARAEISDGVVRIGVLNDISGIFQDTNGMGSVEAARMAAEDFAGGGKNIKVEIVYADHQNKADVAHDSTSAASPNFFMIPLPLKIIGVTRYASLIVTGRLSRPRSVLL